MNIQADRAKELFLDALEIVAADDRRGFLDRACAGDTALRHEVDELLEHHDRAGSFLATIPRPSLGDETGDFDDASRAEPGAVIGSYRLLEELGEGGMGLVFVAEQTEPVRRKVALKLIKPGMDSRQIVARFEAERQALALMDHPNIAKVLDADSTRDGRPFFVMELVRGAAITAYCDTSHLTVRQRLELFVQVCGAVQHAHQKGVIHRDIKPSNVLVTELDGKPTAKVIDFGIAKAVGQQLTDKTLYTRFMQIIGTPMYMSPEQAGLSALDVDTRADVYSLGVLLYELLTGTTPFDKERMRTVGFDELRRIIREEEPARPSARLSTLAAEASTVSANRGTDPRRLTRQVRGELDWVVMKALEKDRNRRYESAAAFAADVQRYLADEPVEACPLSAAYRLRKFARRNKAALAAASALVALLILAVAGLSTGYYFVTLAKKDTEKALEKEREAVGDRDVALTLKNEALKEKEKQRVLANTNKDEALANLREAREAVKSLLHNVAMNDHFQGIQATERVALLSSAIPPLERFVKQHADNTEIEADRGRAFDDLAFLRSQMGMPVQALADADSAVAIFRRLAEAHPSRPEFRMELAQSLNSRANVLDQLRQFHPAEQAQREAADLMERLAAEFPWEAKYREQHSMMLNNIGVLLKDTDRAKEAIPVLDRVIAIRKKLIEEHDQAPLPRTESSLSWFGVTLTAIEAAKSSANLRLQLAQVWVSLGGAFHLRHELDRAESAFEEARRVLDHESLRPRPGSPELVRTIKQRGMVYNNLANIQYLTRRYQEAVKNFREAISHKESLASKFPSVPHYRYDLAGSLMNLGNVLSDMHDWDDAQKMYERAVRIFGLLHRDYRSVPEYAIGLAGAVGNLAKLLGDRGGLEDSLQDLDFAVATLVPFHSADPRDVKVRNSLYACYHIRAITLCGLKRNREARDDWDRAVELAPPHELLNSLSKRSSNFLALGEFELALVDIRAIAESPKADGKYLFIAASGYAVVAAETRDEALAEARAARAVVLLREAMVKGYKCPPDQLNRFGDLRVLKGREDFQKLMQDEEAIHRAAVKLTPEDPERHYILGHVLSSKGRVPEGLAYLRAAIRLRPEYADAHEMIGYVLDNQGDLTGAEAAYREAIKHYTDKDNGYRARVGLGNILGRQQRQPEAANYFRGAIDLYPRRAEAYFGLGLALGEQGRIRESIDAFRSAIECDEKAANARCNLGFALMQVGEYEEAKEELTLGIDLSPPEHPVRKTMQRLMADCDRLNGFAKRLPALLAGKDEPANDAELVGFADVCLARGHYPHAAVLYAVALRPQAKPPAVYRADAARAAVLAAVGPRLPFGMLEKERTVLRNVARDWLVDETNAWPRTVEGGVRAVKALTLWKRHPDFASVRDRDALAALPPAERAAWRQFWSDVDALIKLATPKASVAPEKK